MRTNLCTCPQLRDFTQVSCQWPRGLRTSLQYKSKATPMPWIGRVGIPTEHQMYLAANHHNSATRTFTPMGTIKNSHVFHYFRRRTQRDPFGVLGAIHVFHSAHISHYGAQGGSFSGHRGIITNYRSEVLGAFHHHVGAGALTASLRVVDPAWDWESRGSDLPAGP